MFHNHFIDSFSQLGKQVQDWLIGERQEPELDKAINLTFKNNPFFTPFMQQHSLETIARTFLVRGELERWLGNYVVPQKEESATPASALRVGVIMAGNLPLVGFHDLLCILACGAHAVVKLSSKDRDLLPALLRILVQIHPDWEHRITCVEDLGTYVNQHPDTLSALISTGSDVTREAVSRQFSQIPLLLRGRRFSFAVLSGKEREEELEALAADLFLYFGMGCRSVNYLWVPRGYDFTKMCAAFSGMQDTVSCDSYRNHYRRNRAVLTLEEQKFIDGGFFLLWQTPDVYPPVAVTGYAEYDSPEDVLHFENENRGHIQKKYCTFGLAQAPAIDEYPDGVDTMAFILEHTYLKY